MSTFLIWQNDKINNVTFLLNLFISYVWYARNKDVKRWRHSQKVKIQLYKKCNFGNFYFVPGGFQCTAKGIFISKDLKLGEIGYLLT